MFLNEEVRYKITTAFGQLDDGVVINAILLLRDGEHGLIYHPHVRGECPAIEVVTLLRDELHAKLDVWVTGENNYVNIVKRPTIFEKFLMGKDFTFKRQVVSSKEDAA